MLMAMMMLKRKMKVYAAWLCPHLFDSSKISAVVDSCDGCEEGEEGEKMAEVSCKFAIRTQSFRSYWA